MRKRIELTLLRSAPRTLDWAKDALELWKATSRRFGVSAYGRTIQEAKRRLFITTEVERRNRALAFISRMKTSLLALREQLGP